MGRLKSRNDPLGVRQQVEALQSLVIADRHIRSAPRIFKVAVLRAYARIVQPRRHRVRRPYLSGSVLQQIGQGPM